LSIDVASLEATTYGPPLLATGAGTSRLIEEGLRMDAGIVKPDQRGLHTICLFGWNFLV
jgi:hypothetical protein